MSYLPSKTCFQSLRFTHCMPASLLSAPPPFPPPHPGFTSLSLGFIKSMSLSHSYCVRPIHRFRRMYLSLPFSRQHGHFSPNLFGPGVALDCGCCHSLAPPHSPLSPAHSPPPQPGVPHDFLRVVLSSVAALFLLPHPPHHSRPLWGLLLRFFGLRACRWTIHVLRSRSMATSARRFRCLLFFPLLPVSGVCMLSPPKQEPRIIPGCLG
jgi:hypothetical protein